MYIPRHFRQEDHVVLADFIRNNSFGTLVTVLEGVPFATPLPFILDTGRGEHGVLRGHLARANPQGMELSNSEVLAMFHGPHAYISPAWYTELQSVPTWNYMAVHVYGEARITTADELIDILQCTVQSFEQHRDKPWRMNSLPAEYIDNMARGIVGFEIDIQRIEGKFKLAQNRSQEDVLNVISELRLTGAAESAALAEAMSRYSG